MKRNSIYIIGVAKTARRVVVGCLLLFSFVGSLVAQQTTGQFVIKTGTGNNTHYLSHAGNALGDAMAFSPSCLWTSDNTYTQGGTNKNYYFMEGTTPHFLGAPNFEPYGELSLSSSLPLANYLSNPESQYYFYRWDNGLGRGVQYYGVDSTYCVGTLHHGWDEDSDECWQVYWVEYNATANKWKLSEESYGLTPNGGKYYAVTITEHDNDTTVVMVNEVPSGLQALDDFVMEYSDDPLATHQVVPTITDYQYTVREAYTTYAFDGTAHYYYGGTDNEDIPDAVPHGPVSVSSYAWTLTGDGATYLSIDDASSAMPTITYATPNNDGHKTATLTLTVTYSDGSKQRSSATILVKTPCQNPTVQEGQEVITYVGVTVSWTPTAESYKVFWKIETESNWNDSIEVGNVTSYTITGLEYQATYEYKVQATSCTTSDPIGPYPTFTTLEEPGLMITGAIFGGGRMADVVGKTEVVVVNFDSIGTVYGGNDIAGSVTDGSTIILGVNSGDSYASYGTTNATVNAPLWLGSVYGGGNGYYTYDGNEPGVEVGTTVLTDGQFHSSVTEVGGDDSYATSGTIPSITKTAITVTDDYVKVDSIFGGARNAFVTLDDASQNGSTITINGGTIFSVFGGNNIGGSQKKGKHYIEVNKTTINLASNIVNGDNTGYGRNFGIRYLFGGGNKAEGSSTDILIKGGQLDNVFAGGNSADVYYANVTVECSLGAIPTGSSYTFGNTYSNAINPSNYSQGTIGENTLYTNYGWDGVNGIYNVRTLYGGNNEAEMQRVPNITLTSGSVGTVYGGGNAGDMMGSASTTINTHNVLYGTYVELNSDKILIDYIYGGCRMSDVFNSTWVDLKKGHVGYVYGGCNISGDVGSTRVNPNAPNVPATLDDQRVLGATYVQAGAGGSNTDLIVYKDLFAGSNGYYHCTSDGIHYNADNLFGTSSTLYAGMEIPTHNETNVMVNNGVTVKGSVYAGGNLAPVGFDDETGFIRGYPELVGMASVFMTGGKVEQNVYGGGNMASIYGRNEVKVSGGTILLGLYGGNDRAGQVAEKTNRKLPTGYGYTVASDNATSLTTGVMTFVGVSGNAQIGTVYGGGNGDYTYGGEGGIPYCGDIPSHPIQPFTFVDIHLNGGTSGGKIHTVYGGGNGVTVRGGAIVFVNIEEPDPAEDYDNVDTIFGGNNKGDLVVVPDIRLVHGQVGTVYGGCNRGAMVADENVSGINYLQTIGGYENIGSYVRLRNTYDPTNPAGTGGNVNVTAKVTKAIYGGCRMNGVTRNSLVLVEGGDFSAIPIFGGSDISGTVSGFSRVAVTNGTVGNVYGGGNGNYTYEDGNVYTIPATGDPVLVATGVTTAPNSVQSGVDMTNGTAANLYASGNACGSGTTVSNISGGTVTTGIYGGSNAKGIVTGDIELNVTGGTIGASISSRANIHGGGYGAATQTSGDVTVNIGATSGGENPTYSGTAVINGDVYGGSALGQVSASDMLTQVNFYKGTINGDVYGGALGNNDYAAEVSGNVEVNIHGGVFNAADGTLGGGRIFGCNNANGTPKGNVNVNIYATDHGADFENNLYPTTPDGGWTVAALATNALTQTYAIGAVYGGGNKAAYKPVADKSATVHIYYCNNTIDDVYGGGNAADMGTTGTGAIPANTFVIVDGGRINRVFGGGNGAGADNPGANIYGTATTTVKAGLINQVFGGGNEKGSITATSLTVNHASSGCEEVISEIFGGGNLAPITTSEGISTLVECGTDLVGDIYGGSNKAKITGNVTLNIKGGAFENVFGGSKGVAGTPADIDGNVTLNLMGGKITNAFGGSNINGNITCDILVNVVDLGETCGLDLTNVYGGGNVTPYTPGTGNRPVVNVIHIAQTDGIKGNVFGGAKGSTATVTANPIVNIGYDATSMSNYVTGLTIPDSPRAYVKGNVFGGGDAAPVSGSTTVNVFKGEIVHKLVGGGNAADVTGNATINITGGMICTELTGIDAGVYGGCNTSGTVGGDIEINITSNYAPSADTTVIGTKAALNHAYSNNHVAVSVHGGGYGDNTHTNGNVTVNYGGGGGSGTDNDYPKLYGELYGGSALGTVNHEIDPNDPIDLPDQTIVNIVNGSVKYVEHTVNNVRTQTGGYIFGGGRGQEGELNKWKGQVNGVVHVNIGGGIGDDAYGKANLKGCNIFGCNNTNGSPQQDVYVDVYQTHHVEEDSVDYQNGHDFWNEYAIRNVYGGGNKANYQPTYNNENRKKAHNTIHNCYNTIEYVYGGGNAANTIGTVVSVDGGRFKYIFGGGNGQVTPANIGDGGVNISIYGGHVGWYFNGCNLHGTISGGVVEQYGCPEGMTCPCEGQLLVDKYYFGANEAITVGGLSHIINCGDNMTFKYVYGGSRLAVVYGDIKLWVRGGEIENLFAGNEGSDEVRADVKKYPAPGYDWTSNPDRHPLEVKDYLDEHPGQYGKGGNLQLVLEGGHLGKVYGGNDYRGNVEGDILIIVDSTQQQPCELYIDYLYGGNKLSGYTPDSLNHQVHLDPTHISPRMYLKNGKVNYDVFGGSEGGDVTHPYGNGLVVCNPLVVIGNPTDPNDKARVGRDVFGGGSSAVLEGNPVVVLQGKTTVGGNVFGGGKEGDIVGGTNVVIDPDTPYETADTPIPPTHKLHFTACPVGAGNITVTYHQDDEIVPVVSDETDIPEGTILNITVEVNEGYTFDEWWTDFGHVDHTTHITTTCLMGSRDTELKARFVGCE